MKILFVCQQYWPEPYNSTDVCENLVRKGHDVTVLTGFPDTGLPGGNFPPRYKRNRCSDEYHKGVRIFRIKHFPRKTGALNRILNYLSFWFNGNRSAKKLEGQFDVVIGYQFSPVMQVDPGVKYAEKHGTPFLLYCFDLWPESLAAGGFKKNSLAYKWTRRISRRIYSQADCIAVTSPLFEEYFKSELGLVDLSVVYLPQYAEDAFGRPAYRIPDGYESGKIHFTFAGNVGAAQSVSTLVSAAALLKDDGRFSFHVVGSGSELDSCRDLARRLGASNVLFHGLKPVEEMPSYYAASDAMVATFSDEPVLAYTLPRKIQSYMAAAKPILGALTGEARRTVEAAGCGWCCPPEDAEGLAEICRLAADCPDLLKMGESGRTYYEAHFSKARFFNALEIELENLKGTKHGERHSIA